MKKITFWIVVAITLVLVGILPLSCTTPTKPDGSVDTVKQCNQEVTAMQVALSVARPAALALFGPDPVVQGLIGAAQKALAEAKSLCASGDATGFDVALEAFNQSLGALATFNLSDYGIAAAAASEEDGPIVVQPMHYAEAAAILEGRRLQQFESIR